MRAPGSVGTLVRRPEDGSRRGDRHQPPDRGREGERSMGADPRDDAGGADRDDQPAPRAWAASYHDPGGSERPGGRPAVRLERAGAVCRSMARRPTSPASSTMPSRFALDLRVDRSPARSALSFAGKSLDIAPQLRRLPRGTLATLKVPLRCFADAGASVASVGTPDADRSGQWNAIRHPLGSGRGGRRNPWLVPIGRVRISGGSTSSLSLCGHAERNG